MSPFGGRFTVAVPEEVGPHPETDQDELRTDDLNCDPLGLVTVIVGLVLLNTIPTGPA